MNTHCSTNFCGTVYCAFFFQHHDGGFQALPCIVAINIKFNTMFIVFQVMCCTGDGTDTALHSRTTPRGCFPKAHIWKKICLWANYTCKNMRENLKTLKTNPKRKQWKCSIIFSKKCFDIKWFFYVKNFSSKSFLTSKNALTDKRDHAIKSWAVFRSSWRLMLSR